MINEFMQLAKALPREGLKEDKLLPLRNGNVYRVWLTKDGKVSNIELLSKETHRLLRCYSPNNKYSFPAFNQLVVSKYDVAHANEHKKATDGIHRNIIEFPKRKDLELWKVKNLVNDGETLGQVFKAFDAVEDENDFLEDLVGHFRGKGFGVSPTKSVTLFFDVEDYIDYPMSHPHTLNRLNEILCGCDNEDVPHDGVDAFGMGCVGAKKLMRQLRTPYLGNIKLRSSNKNVPALKRYGVTESESFPIGSESRARAEIAFQWVFDKENAGLTYAEIRRIEDTNKKAKEHKKAKEQQEILLAYPADISKRGKHFSFVKPFSGRIKQQEDRLVFAKTAKEVIDLLKGEGQDLPNRELRIFSIRKMDKARTKVVYYRNIDVATLALASDAWDEGCHNLPTLDVKDWPRVSKKERKIDAEKRPVPVEIETVFPARLYQYLNKYYKRDFTSEDIEVSRFKPSTGIELMLMNEHEVASFALSILSQLIIQSGNYYRELCLCVGQNKVSSAKSKGIHLGILGLLLYKVGKRKENYMNDTAFQLGKFLRIADGLHKCYCENERRDGQCARELCGSAMISAMMENPTVALSQLGQRSAPYVKWAQSCQREKSAGLARWWLRQWQPIADALHASELPKRLTDAERAEVFLGYLSSLPRKENTQSANNDFETNETEPCKGE